LGYEKLKKVKPGDLISADQQNLIRQLLRRVSADRHGIAVGDGRASRTTPQAPATQWFKATEEWTHSADDNSCFVMADPCENQDGDLPKSDRETKVWLPRQGLELDPNIETDDVFLASVMPMPDAGAAEPECVAISPNLDGKVWRSIQAWHGTVVPDGWHLCDGSVITGRATATDNYLHPDLRGRFIVGYHSSAGLACTSNKGAENDYGSIGWMWGTAWHGVEEYDDWDGDSSAAQSNNHPDHKDHVHSVDIKPIGMVDPMTGPFPCGADLLWWSGIQKTTPCHAAMVFRHAGPFNAWPSGDTDEEVHSFADTDNRPPFYTLAFIIRVDNSEDQNVPIATELPTEALP